MISSFTLKNSKNYHLFEHFFFLLNSNINLNNQVLLKGFFFLLIHETFRNDMKKQFILHFILLNWSVFEHFFD